MSVGISSPDVTLIEVEIRGDDPAAFSAPSIEAADAIIAAEYQHCPACTALADFAANAATVAGDAITIAPLAVPHVMVCHPAAFSRLFEAAAQLAAERAGEVSHG